MKSGLGLAFLLCATTASAQTGMLRASIAVNPNRVLHRVTPQVIGVRGRRQRLTQAVDHLGQIFEHIGNSRLCINIFHLSEYKNSLLTGHGR